MAFQGRDVGPEKLTPWTWHGKPIILSKTRGRPVTGLVAKGMERGIFPDSKKQEVVALWAVCGKAATISELTGVPESTVKNWRKQEWFLQALAEIRAENNERLDAQTTAIIEKSYDQIQDRLDNGELVLNHKTGELVRRPVGVKDLALVAAITIDKRQLIRGLPTSRTETVSAGGDKLAKLAEAFEALANKRKPATIDVTDAVVVETKAPDAA